MRHGLPASPLVGVFGVYCALTANASRVSDVVPTLVGTAAAMGVLVAARARRGRARRGPAPAAAAGLARRRFLEGSAGAALAAVAGFGGRAAQHRRFDASAARAKVVLPAARTTTPCRAGSTWARARCRGVPRTPTSTASTPR